MSLTQIKKAGLDEIALDHVFTISHSGTSAYTFQGEGLNGTVSNPTLYLTRGKTYRFENVTGAHAIRIQSADNGTNGTLYNTGVTNNNSTGTVIVEVQHDAPDVLYYQCAVHAAMKGTLYITGALADGGVTEAKLAVNAVTNTKIANQAIDHFKLATGAVTSDKIADNSITTNDLANSQITTAKIATDAVTNAKIASDAVGSAEIANNAITTVKIADSAVSNNKLQDNSIVSGKLADSGVNSGSYGSATAIPAITVNNKGQITAASTNNVNIPAGTTINANADNRVITGSGTANTLNAETEVLFDATTSDFSIIGSQPNRVMDLIVQNTHNGGAAAGARLTLESGSNANTGPQLGMRCGTHTWYLQVPKAAGNLEFNNNDSGTNFLMADDGDFHINDGDLVIGTGGHGIDFSADGNGTLKTLPSSFNAELLHDYENGTFTPNIQYDTGTGRYAGSQVSSAVGEYIRIGDLVNVGMKITLTSNQNHTENTHIYIGGMPYNGMHSSQQSSMMNGWGGWACPTNDNNFSYKVRYCFHGYTTINLGFSQNSGNGGISGFYVWGFYRTAP